MSVCQYCDGEKLDGISCRDEPILIRGKLYEPIRWGSESSRYLRPTKFPCRDCATPLGGIHHPGCYVEQCPACQRGQALGCPCFDGPEEDWLAAQEERMPPHWLPKKGRCRAHFLSRRSRN